ncbi:DUF2809 domain-containing protein [Cryobacterium sp. TMT3-29-2]|uniref:ribosomal maturation YjgA family protein n=1 Tax=Cryobacterium sp. TMT3-29-2 TaxID=2555867 RepID=UPI0010738D35|nr:DUF2809 domain-containing protein [Cryobacterium sp. TMT3-29-2]TFC90464.1 DUF2809 domain-containing protein [Cryobacterium sp. TMT3-29-2]
MSGRRRGEPGSAVGKRSRIGIVVAGAVVTVAGLVVSTSVAGAAGDVGGGMLYAVLVYLGVLFVAPRSRPLVTAATAFGLCALIEFAQLTGAPAALAEWFPPIRLVLGTTFVATDLVAYLSGVIAVGAVDAAARRRR